MEISDRELLAELVVESQDHLATIEPDLLALDGGGPAAETMERVNRIFRGIHSIKGGCGFLGIAPVQELAHAMESALMKVRSRQLEVSRPLVDVLLDGTDRVRTMLADVANAAAVDARDLYRRLEPFLAEGDGATPPAPTGSAPVAAADRRSGFIPLAKPAREPVSGAAADPEDAAASLAPAAAAVDPGDQPEAGGSAQRGAAPEVLRVRVDLLNRLMNLAGELVLARNQLLQAVDRRFSETAAGESVLAVTQAAV
ncbi:hypothetical protein FJ250_07755, partial [bacterium]|nr:hypothetical protein [bacterium]